MAQEEKRESLTTHQGIPGGQWWNPFNNHVFDYVNLTGRRCPDFYMDFLRCSERTGLQNSASRCKEQFEDLKECLTHVKRNERLTFIKAERLRQGRARIDPLPTYAEQSGEHTINTEKMTDDFY